MKCIYSSNHGWGQENSWVCQNLLILTLKEISCFLLSSYRKFSLSQSQKVWSVFNEKACSYCLVRCAFSVKAPKLCPGKCWWWYMHGKWECNFLCRIQITHFNRDKIESNLSVSGIQGCHVNALPSTRASKQDPTWYVSILALTSL